MLKNLVNQKGFSLIEIIVVMVIFVIILSSVVSLAGDETVQEDLSAKTASIVDFLNRARNYAVTGYYGDHWGIRILDNSTDCYSTGASGDCMILFKGKIYNDRNSDYDEKLLFDTGVYLDSDQDNQFYFEKVSGWLSTTTGALTGHSIKLSSNIGSEESVVVTPVGLVYSGNRGYAYRRSITIDNSKVNGSTDLVYFPVFVSEHGTYLKTKANGGKIENNSGFDIIFASDVNGNHKLAHEVESYDASIGEINAWVNVETLKTGDNTVIYMFYSNPDIYVTQEDAANVWDSNYKMVQHMNEDPSGSAPQIIDSTSNNHDGTASGAFDSGDLMNSQLGKGIDFNHTDTQFTFASANPIGTAENGFTLSAWVKNHNSSDSGQHIVSFSKIQLRPTICYVWDTTWRSVNYSAYDPSSDTWYYLVCKFDGENWRAYIDSSETTPASPTAVAGDITNPTTFVVGYLQGAEWMNGVLDEIRISDIPRSDDWIVTEYNNQYSTSTFYTLGSETSN